MENDALRFLRRRRLRIIAVLTPAIYGLLLLTYRLLAGDGDQADFMGNFLRGSTGTITIIVLFAMSVVAALMFYLQSPSLFSRTFARDFFHPAMLDDLRHDSFSQREQLSALLDHVERLKSQVNAVSSTKEAFTKEQTAALVENVKQRIESEASAQILDELRQNVQTDARLREVLAYARDTEARLNREVSALTRRGNLNLSIGIVTTASGLGVLAYIVFGVSQLPMETWALASHYLPRITLVIFIELFAYFFLRLYKSTLSENKYFQNELTNVESKRLALLVALNQGDLPAVAKVVEDLAKTERNFILEKGQTTVELEKSRVNNESSLTILEKAGSIMEKLRPSKK